MAQHTRRFMYCDSPVCTNREEGEVEPATGIYIDTGREMTLDGAYVVKKLYACSIQCLPKAWDAVRNEAYEDGPRKKW